MKYAVLLCDGMSDLPNEALGGKTPMEIAKKPNMDALARTAEIGLCKTVADGMKPGSDVANLSVMGYDPAVCYTGRSPLEAASIGIDLKDTDVTLRCNLVTLSDDENYEDKVMLDYCAGDISTKEAQKLIGDLEEKLGDDIHKFYSGVAYRHCLVVDNGTTDLGNLTPPHDITGEVIKDYLSDSENAKPLINMMKKSYEILMNHPVNKERIQKGEKPANSIWFWGEGKKPALENFYEKNGVKGGVVSAVDLLKGIGKLGGMEVAEVDGATGYIDTNFEGKAKAATDMLRSGCDYVYLHIEAPDECGHRGEGENKVKAIEMIDEKVLPVLLDTLRENGDFRLLIMPDHPTPLALKTHTSDPVPYLLYDSRKKLGENVGFSEEIAKNGGTLVDFGPNIMKKLTGE